VKTFKDFLETNKTYMYAIFDNSALMHSAVEKLKAAYGKKTPSYEFDKGESGNTLKFTCSSKNKTMEAINMLNDYYSIKVKEA